MAAIPQIYQLRVSLNNLEPIIWRRFQVRSDVKLTRLHDMLQILMGWENYHLYCFDVDGVEYTDPDSIEDDIYELGHQDGSKIKLSQALAKKGDKCLYRYDFGDNWEHTLLLEQISDPIPDERYPVCLDGARRCPPEDCGGIGGYAELLRVLADSDDEEYEDMKRWIVPRFDPEKFDCLLVNCGLPRRVIVKE
ncbi:MAG: plasmid pRiA4b ORF-3 family protein [Armatimonadota bacterium]